MRNTERKAERSCSYYALQPLTAGLPELASKLERLECSCWFYPEHRREYQRKRSTDHSSGERCYKIVEVHFAEMTGAEQASVTTEHISVV